MRKMLKAWLFTMLLLLPCMLASAGSLYPDTLDNGNYVCVDGGMGVGTYADRSSVVVQNYNPPNYQIAINIIRAQFSDDYWSKHETYVGGPYKVIGSFTAYFRYNWDRKSVACLRQNGWMDWNIHHDYSHAEGNPFVPHAAEVAFVSAYKMRFFNDTMGYSPVLKEYRRVIDESFYRTLGI